MFTAYYGMDFNPFTNEIDPKFKFQSNDFLQSSARLDILKQHKGIGLLTGEPGSGKSFTLKCLAASLNKSLYKIIYIPITTLTVKEFYMALCDGLGVIHAYKKVDMFKQIQESICAYAAKNITPVIIVDEIQFISNSILDDFRMILNFDMDSKNYCIVVFSGQPKLVIQLNRQHHEALRQRIAINYSFTGLSRSETQDYIASRFKACGRPDIPMEESVYEFIFTTTGGFPRKVNQLMTMALLIGVKDKIPVLNSDILLKANDEINIVAS
ncbi:MAG: ExeA family protein [Desulfitobacteriia bacterium]|jgi:type II secretory pathway predicted ATPase ExeA